MKFEFNSLTVTIEYHRNSWTVAMLSCGYAIVWICYRVDMLSFEPMNIYQHFIQIVRNDEISCVYYETFIRGDLIFMETNLLTHTCRPTFNFFVLLVSVILQYPEDFFWCHVCLYYKIICLFNYSCCVVLFIRNLNFPIASITNLLFNFVIIHYIGI